MNRNTLWLAGAGCWLLMAGLVALHPAKVRGSRHQTAATISAQLLQSHGAASKARLLSAAAAQSFWRRHELGHLWALSPLKGHSSAAMGFFGKEGFRIDFALLEVRHDALRPHVYYVRGKSRCLRDAVVPFRGTITLRQVYQAPPDAYGPAYQNYTVVGSYEFTEDKIAPNTGVFRGTLATDVLVHGGEAQLGQVPGSQAAGCGYKFAGQWRGSNGQTDPVLWSGNWRTLGNQLFEDFEGGDRMPSISPQYARRGWNRYWENDEWWADAPAPKVNM